MASQFEPFFEDHRADSAFIHESSYVDSPCRIGENTSVLHFAHVMAHSIIGDNCVIGHSAMIASGVLLGNYVRVMNHAMLNSGVIMEDAVYCGPHTVFTEGRYMRANHNGISRVSPTLVRVGAQIGPHVSIASGHIIGQHAFIEAGTVVDRNIPDFAVVYGNPLKVAGWRCGCGQSLPSSNDAEMACSYCGKRYLRQSRWKVVQLIREGLTHDSSDTHPQPDASIRIAEGQD